MLHNSSSKILAVITLASVVTAQQSVLDSLSASCSAALKALLVAPEAQCLNTGAFISIAAGGSVDVPAIATKWLTGLCSSGSCSTASLTSIVNNVTAGCAEDVKQFGIDISDPTVVLPLVQQYYPSVRQIACLKDTSANTLCVPQTLTNLQTVVGTLGINDLNVDTIITSAQKIAASDYKNLACTSCAKQAYTIAAKVFPDPSLLATLNGPITDTCGASFIDGQNVTTVAQTAVAGEFSVNAPASGSASFKPITIAGAVLITTCSVFTLLV